MCWNGLKPPEKKQQGNVCPRCNVVNKLVANSCSMCGMAFNVKQITLEELEKEITMITFKHIYENVPEVKQIIDKSKEEIRKNPDIQALLKRFGIESA